MDDNDLIQSKQQGKRLLQKMLLFGKNDSCWSKCQLLMWYAQLRMPHQQLHFMKNWSNEGIEGRYRTMKHS